MFESSGYEEKFYERYVKRMFDIVFSIFALIVLGPFSLLCMLAIKLENRRGKIFFRQDRNGKNGKVFQIVKFRTMKQEMSGTDIDPTMDTLTGVGKVVRKLSLDEIPQLVSILRGQMSLIGPRPLLLSYYEWFNETEMRRFDVRPGLTGMSQINGRVNLNWDERFELDVQYVDNLSFWLDVKIFFKTFLVVFSHKDVIADDNNALERFDEYRKRVQRKKEIFVVKQHAKKRVVASRSKTFKVRG